MIIKKFAAPIALLAASALSLTACAANETPAAPGAATAGALSGTLAGKGASSMKVGQEAWIAAFQTKNPGVTINYSPDGSGAGREAFISGAVQYAGSDRAFKDEEMGKGKFGKCSAESSALNLPVFIAPIAVIYKVDGVKDLQLDAETTASIFAGKITKWNDPKIVALNPGKTFPDATITAVHRSDDSGTTENFVDYLAQNAPSIWSEKVAGTWPVAYGGEGAKANSGVVDAVKNGKNTIGYAEESQAQGLDMAKVKVGDAYFGPTPEAAAKIVDNATKVAGRSANDFALKLDRKAAGQYPIALVSYALVCEQYKDAKEAALVKAYVGYMVSAEGQKAAQAKAGNAPLSADYSAKLKTAVDSIK